MYIDGFTAAVHGHLDDVLTASNDVSFWFDRHAPAFGVLTPQAAIRDTITSNITAAISRARRALGIELPIHRTDDDEIAILYHASRENDSIRILVHLNLDITIRVSVTFSTSGNNVQARVRAWLADSEIQDETRTLATVPALVQPSKVILLPDLSIEVPVS